MTPEQDEEVAKIKSEIRKYREQKDAYTSIGFVAGIKSCNKEIIKKLGKLKILERKHGNE